jgi:hypothetical protein
LGGFVTAAFETEHQRENRTPVPKTAVKATAMAQDAKINGQLLEIGSASAGGP